MSSRSSSAVCLLLPHLPAALTSHGEGPSGGAFVAWLLNLALGFTLSVGTTLRDRSLLDLNASRTRCFLWIKLFLTLPVFVFLFLIFACLIFRRSHLTFIQRRLCLVCVCMPDDDDDNARRRQVKTLYLCWVLPARVLLGHSSQHKHVWLKAQSFSDKYGSVIKVLCRYKVLT